MAYCDALHAKPVADIDTAAVRQVLDPIWHTLPETASRLRGRIERILDAAKVDELRSGENPARWKGHLDQVYPAKRKVRRVEHHAALPWKDVPAFVARLRKRSGVAEWCLEWLILTAVRSAEARSARWADIDLDAARWVTEVKDVAGTGKVHAVPLSEPALALLRRMQDLALDPVYVFPSPQVEGQPVSDTSLRNLLRDMGLSGDDATVHGMRSSFRDFAAEATHAPNIVAEKALAHGISDGTEAAYRRGDLFEKRRELMDEWAAFCERGSASKRPQARQAEAAKSDSEGREAR